jgi:pyridoxamine 5'-phosphate oxidase
MKELDKDGSVIIYSNWEHSKKAGDVATNKYVALTFFWKELERQVRIEGTCERLTTEESQIYFDKRPRASRIGAWASPQSTVVNSREELDQFVEQQEKRFEDQDKIPCPPFWGGIRVRPIEWEFFQGRPNRVHDRFSYVKNGDKWVIQRLAS